MRFLESTGPADDEISKGVYGSTVCLIHFEATCSVS